MDSKQSRTWYIAYNMTSSGTALTMYSIEVLQNSTKSYNSAVNLSIKNNAISTDAMNLQNHVKIYPPAEWARLTSGLTNKVKLGRPFL